MKKLLVLSWGAGLIWAAEPQDLLLSDVTWQFSSASGSSISVSEGKMSITGNWKQQWANHTLQTPLDLSLLNSSATFTYTIGNIATNYNALATVTLFSAANDALITGWGAYDKSGGMQAGVVNIQTNQQSQFRLKGTDNNDSTATGVVCADPLEGIKIESPFTGSDTQSATVTVTVRNTGTAQWELTVSCNDTTQSITLGGNEADATAYNIDLSQLTAVTVSLAGADQNSNKLPQLTALTMSYQVPEPVTGALAVLSVAGLCLRRRK